MNSESTAAFKAQRRLTALQQTGDSHVSMGNLPINSVFGRTEDAGAVASQSGTSIFDPVLCELVYRWFCPPGGLVLDPFAGGSVRGIVAGVLGRRYVGVDLSAAQLDANRAQWPTILAKLHGLDAQTTRAVKVSAAMARLPFHGCEPHYIATVCHAACCDSSTSPTGTLITIHPREQAAIEQRGGIIAQGMLQPRAGERRCPLPTPVAGNRA